MTMIEQGGGGGNNNNNNSNNNNNNNDDNVNENVFDPVDSAEEIMRGMDSGSGSGSNSSHRALIGGNSAENQNASSHGKLSLDIASRVASLSPRERQVMDGLVAGLSNKLIAREHNISPRTIEVYRANVMTKMQAHSLSELIRLALRAGILND